MTTGYRLTTPRYSSTTGSLLLLLVFGATAAAQAGRAGLPEPRIRDTPDDRVTVRLHGNLHPLAVEAHSTGTADPSTPMERVILSLHGTAEQDDALEKLLNEQADPESANYRKWLEPGEFAQRFGVHPADLDRISSWLSSRALNVEEVSAGGRAIVFSGTTSQIEAAFRSPINIYRVDGGPVHANTRDPEAPAALAGLMDGIVSLNDFSSRRGSARGALTPQFTYAGSHYMAPADFAAIYNVTPLYNSGVSGRGQSIAIAARTNLTQANIARFRSFFGLGVNAPTVIVNGKDPGIVSATEETEALLDTEWAGAVAPEASVTVVVSASTAATDGALLSAQYIVNNNLAPIVLVPFGVCEPYMGQSQRDFVRRLWQQAAAQGMTLVVSAGDSGAAGCDGYWQTRGSGGAVVNGLCATPYNVCVGGTQFDDTASPYSWWASSNAQWGQSSALSYIPETAWNESAANGGLGLYGGGGGGSSVYAKPSWQRGAGVPADAKRDVPDISFAAGLRDGYLVWTGQGLQSVSGTSAAAAAFAGIAALLNERTATRQGNIAPNLYSLAALQSGGASSGFHDISRGNNTVPGVNGFTAGSGYDMATGLGSLDAAQLISQWAASGGPLKPAFTLQVTPSPISLPAGGTTAVSVATAFDSKFQGPVTLTATGLPPGVTVSPASVTITSPRSVSFTFTASSAAAPGSFAASFAGVSGAIAMSESVPLVVIHRSSGWTLVWSDEFNGAANTSPDASHWQLDTGAGGWGNGELQTYTNLPQNASLDGNGNLIVRTVAQNGGYTSARLASRNRYSVKYGRIEARMQLPAGTGLWSGFWMLGATCETTGWPACGEVDIAENRGTEAAISHGSIHGPGYSGGSSVTGAYTLPGGQKFSDGFHTFAIEWSPQLITFFVDDIPYQSATPASLPSGGAWVFDQPFYLLLDVAVGGGFAGPPDSTTKFPQQMRVDYVRVYQAP